MIGIGQIVGGRFRVDQVLGAGGMGVVVAATHQELGHRVAIKLLRDEWAEDPRIVERFYREAKAVVGLRTDNVCRVSDVGRLETGEPYIVMELLEGVDLQRTVARSPLPVTTAVEYVLQACIALSEAHGAGIIHRDLKPANLFVTRRLDGGPLVKVLDFGIAKALSEPGVHATSATAMGSPGYMSPEQIESARDVDLRTDIWALGVVLYQLLSGRLPFRGANPTEIAVNVMTMPPDAIDIDPRLRAIVFRCLDKLPTKRFESVGELMVALAPFGGPSARQHIAMAAQLGARVSGFVTPPPVTQTGVTVVTRGEPTPIAPVKTSPVTVQHKPRNLIAVAVIAIAVVAGVIAVLATMDRGSPVVVRSDAQVMAAIVVDGAVRDAAPPGPDPWHVDRVPVDATIIAVDARPDAPRVKKTSHEHPDIVSQMALASRQLDDPKVCAQLVNSAGSAMMPLGLRFHCACVLKDQKLAQRLFGAFDDDMKASARTACNQHGDLIP